MGEEEGIRKRERIESPRRHVAWPLSPHSPFPFPSIHLPMQATAIVRNSSSALHILLAPLPAACNPFEPHFLPTACLSPHWGFLLPWGLLLAYLLHRLNSPYSRVVEAIPSDLASGVKGSSATINRLRKSVGRIPPPYPRKYLWGLASHLFSANSISLACRLWLVRPLLL